MMEFYSFVKGLFTLQMTFNFIPSWENYTFLNGQQKEAKTIWTAGTEKFKNNRSYYQIMVSLYGRLSLDKEIISLLDIGREKFGQSFMAYEAGNPLPNPASL